MTPDAHHEQAGPQEITLEHKIDSICARRESELCALQERELRDLEMYAEREGRLYFWTCDSVVKNMHTIATSDKLTTNMLLEKTIQKFKAFQEHVACEQTKLQLLQEKVRTSEKLRKEKWITMVKSGRLEKSFDFNQIPLPDSGFVFEKFDWVCGERAMNYGVSSSQENVLKKLDNVQPIVGALSSAVAGALNNMGGPRIQPHVIPVGRRSDVHPINTCSDEGSNSANFNLMIQQEIDASPARYTGPSAVTDEIRISQQLSTNFMAEQTPVNPEEFLDCAGMLLEPGETETITGFASGQASNPDIGISALSRPDVLLESSNNFLAMPRFTQEMFPKGLNGDPLVNELTRITHGIKDLSKKQEEKKSVLRSQWEGEVQSMRRKYDELTKEEDAKFRKHKKFLQGLTCEFEAGQTVERELTALKMAGESDIPLQDWTQPSTLQKTPRQPACRSESACTSSGLSPCMPPQQNTQAPPVGRHQVPPIITNQVSSAQTKLAPPFATNRDPVVPSILTSAPISTSSALHILIDEASTISAKLGQTPVSPIQIPCNSSNQASTIPTNLASSKISSVHAVDDPARLGPNISHIWNLPTQAMNYQHLLNPHTMGMSTSTGWASSVQNPRAPICNTTPVSPVQVPHIRADLAPPLWTSLPRPTSTNQVQPAVASMSHPLSSMVTQTMSPIQPTRLHTGRSRSVMRSLNPSVSTNWGLPIQNASFLGSAPRSQHALNSPYMLRSRSPHLRYLQSHISIGRPAAPQAPLSDISYNLSNFGGSISDLDWRPSHGVFPY